MLGNSRLDGEQATATLGAVIKYHEDQTRVEREILPELLAKLA